MGILRHHLQQAQHCRVVRVIKTSQIIVLAVTGQGVLGQVIGAAAEEIHFLGQTVTHDGRCRGFDHDADLHILRKGNALSFQVALDFLAVLFGFAHFPHAGHHGEHDAQLAERGSTVKGTQLGLEDFRAGQTNTQSAHAHSRVILFGQVKVADLLVRADIQRANDNFLAAHIGKNLFVGFKLLVLGGVIRAVQVQELAAEQADAAAIVDLHGMYIVRGANVAVNADALAILGHIGLAFQGLQQALQAQLFFPLFQQVITGHIVRVDHHIAGSAVNNAGAALILRLQGIAHAHNGGNAHGAGQNGRVAGTGTARSDEAQNLGFIQLHSFRRCQVVRSQQHRHIRSNTALHCTGQDPQDAIRYIAHICRTGLHVGIVHGFKHSGELNCGIRNRGFGVHLFIVDMVGDRFLVIEILSHHLVGLKQHGGFIAGFGAGLFGQFAQLLNGGGLRALETVPLGIGIGHGIAGDLGFGAVIEIKRANANAGRYALALNTDHNKRPFFGVQWDPDWLFYTTKCSRKQNAAACPSAG